MGPLPEPDEVHTLALQPYFFNIHFQLFCYLYLGLPNKFQAKVSYAFSFHSSHPPWFDHPNAICLIYCYRQKEKRKQKYKKFYVKLLRPWERVQIMRHCIMQFSPSPCYDFSFGPLYSSQYPVLKHPQAMFFQHSRKFRKISVEIRSTFYSPVWGGNFSNTSVRCDI
jgi:hypothetical protein